MRTARIAVTVLMVSAGLAAGLRAAPERGPALIGRWDLTVGEGGRGYPSWIEVERSGTATLVGRYVAGGGSARPIAEVSFRDGALQFTVPKQWESGPGNITVEGKLESDRLAGTITDANGRKSPFVGVRAPDLFRSSPPKWGKAVELFDGKSLAGWHVRNPRAASGWAVEGGMLRNLKPATDLITNAKFTDFKVAAEFRYPAGSNSGIYLRGRYEAQIEDDYGLPASSHFLGGIYGFLTPRVNAARKANEWQRIEMTLVGRELTLVLNGDEVITRQNIPGVTGGALDSDEGAPGPLMLQGDHGPIDFRRVTLTAAL